MAALFRRRPPDPADAIHGKIVAQARHPAFYAGYGVADTLDGRFEMLLVHAFLLFHRLKGEDEAARAVGQRVFDILFRDLDRNLREMGVGYAAVPRRVKAMGRAFYGRAGAYDEALEAADLAALVQALNRNVYGGNAGAEQVQRLARYVRAAVGGLAVLAVADLVADGPAFPDPEAL